MTKIFENVSPLNPDVVFKKIFGNDSKRVNVLIIGPVVEDNLQLLYNITHHIAGKYESIEWITNLHEQGKITEKIKSRVMSNVIYWNDGCSDMNYITKELADNIDFVFYQSRNIASIKKFMKIFKSQTGEDCDKFINTVLRSYLNEGYIGFKINSPKQTKKVLEEIKTDISHRPIYGVHLQSWDLLESVIMMIPKKPKILICGPACTGKTTFANYLKSKYYPNIVIYDEAVISPVSEGYIHITQNIPYKNGKCDSYDYIFYASMIEDQIRKVYVNVVKLYYQSIECDNFVNSVTKMRENNKFSFVGLKTSPYVEVSLQKDIELLDFENIDDEEMPFASTTKKNTDEVLVQEREKHANEYKKYKSECIKMMHDASNAGQYAIYYPCHKLAEFTKNLKDKLKQAGYFIADVDDKNEFVIEWGGA